MGMDVYGRNKSGYFRNNIWWWRPLAEYCQEVAPEITAKCKHWQSNDGDGLNKEDAHRLAKALENELALGGTKQYSRARASALERMPNVSCWLCAGTGTRRPPNEPVGAGDPKTTGIRCNSCDGEGVLRPNECMYPFDTKNVEEFVKFLKECDGFEIW